MGIVYSKSTILRSGFSTCNWNKPNWTANKTNVDAKDKGIGFYITNPPGNSGTVLIEGFHITGGYAIQSVSGTDRGGGIYFIPVLMSE